ncbi:alpha,alpha-phosphotrehalase [Anaerococcus degeneri]|uniref:Alpha,alpha-phosphotrehalase n=1 Tax=Anaerococcus degeneri TaxID=361500 RepID=A0ABS7YXI2_9FIRM|nr:alpha,alpha-phosphotrehalase [Anaerococcus degeneri]MBP2016327.1 trehalose-6-phosphate hydrolase [Anaerococcus degeneri]MCA2096363.1 alpha,alpha-phosphotrehalase [Anaerococcus degeneri]
MKNFKDKVIYQIYPKSFKDTTGNGLGDLKGIIEKLDYLEMLGVDYLWITPFFKSPQNDNGYDIEDYYKIDPIYGSMDDLEELIAKAREKNIYLMLDMVFNHTSTNHIWFQKALAGDEYYKNFYFFRKNEGKLPTNWESKFGGPAWEYIEDLDEYYLHLFDKSQADLNWENPNVRRELIKVLNFWLEKGIRGFRFDVINLISKDKFEDDFEGDGRRFYTDGKKVLEYLQELNKNSFGKYDDILTVGEMSSTSIDNCIKYTNPENHALDMAFNFHHLKVDYKDGEKWSYMPVDFEEFKDILEKWQIGMEEGNGWNALFLNCHDQPRSVSRFGDDKNYLKESAKLLATIIHMQEGTPYIYQGEEIGMTNNYFADISDYRDVETINHYHILKEKNISNDEMNNIIQTKSRDNARSPMQWTKEGGFTKANPWMKVNQNTAQINVEENLKDPDSIFRYYQKLIEIRKKYKVISHGSFERLFKNDKNIYAFRRKYNNREALVINNLSKKQVKVKIENVAEYKVILSNYKDEIIIEELKLRPYESIVLYK